MNDAAHAQECSVSTGISKREDKGHPKAGIKGARRVEFCRSRFSSGESS